MRYLLILAGLLAGPAHAACDPLPAAPWTVAARAIDGDTLIVLGTGRQIRLHGIDAPELRDGGLQREGLAARNRLDELVLDRQLACRPLKADRYCRVVAICDGGGGDVAVPLLAEGLAWTMRNYLHGPAWPADVAARYEAAEREARQAGVGLWSVRR